MMAEFRWYRGNDGTSAYQNLSNYSTVAPEDFVDNGSGNLTFTLHYYDPDTGLETPAPGSDPQTIVITMTGAVYEPVLTGPSTGFIRLTEGTITTAQYFDDSDNLLMEATGLTADVPFIVALTNTGDGWHAFQYLNSGGNTYTGSNNSDFEADGGADGWNGDSIMTGTGDDQVNGRGGDDWISDGGGLDVYKGGSGFDYVDYSGWIKNGYILANPTGIVANFKKGWVKGPDGFKDKIYSVEAARGTNWNDKFVGKDGVDHQFNGLGGRDILIGASGSDWARYHRDARYGGDEGIRARLDKDYIRDGFGHKDSLTSIENVRGTDYEDFMRDNGQDNSFRGGGGDDKMVFTGGNDVGRGEGGADTFVFKGNFGDDTVLDFSQSDGDLIKIDGASAMGDLVITDNGSGDALITFGGDTVTLNGIAFGDLSVSDFVF